jgi:hypothetical protein
MAELKILLFFSKKLKMKKPTSLFNIKTVLAFVFTACLGLWLGGFFDGYIFRFGIVRSFSESEAQTLLGKRVRNDCQQKPYSERPGEITGYTKDDFGEIFVNVTWDNMDEEKTGKLFPTGFYLTNVNQCLKPANVE